MATEHKDPREIRELEDDEALMGIIVQPQGYSSELRWIVAGDDSRNGNDKRALRFSKRLVIIFPVWGPLSAIFHERKIMQDGRERRDVLEFRDGRYVPLNHFRDGTFMAIFPANIGFEDADFTNESNQERFSLTSFWLGVAATIAILLTIAVIYAVK